MASGSRPVRANESGPAIRRIWRRLTELPFGPGHITQTTPRSDPTASAAGVNYNFFQQPRWLFGVITDSTAIANVYRVQFGGVNRTLPCTYAPHSSLSCGGARELTTLQPGTSVICVVHHQTDKGYIIAVIPPVTLAANRQILQHLRHSTRARVDEGHKFPLRMPNNGNIEDVTGGRLYDSTTAGEAGWITETGLRIFIDSFMTEIGVDETCGIAAFFHDQLLRIAGYNLQMFTSGSERYGLNDQEEYHDWVGYTPYPWEQLGQWSRQDPRRELTPTQWQIKEPYNAPWEPAVNGQDEPRLQAWHRERTFHGYLGQGGKTIVTGPPRNLPSCNTFAGGSGAQVIFTGLFDQTVGLDGRLTIASAKGISIVKRLGIIAPKQLRQPEQISDEGDNPKNYKFAGMVGDGPEHTITGDVRADSNYPAMQRAAGILDLHAYLFNYSVVHPFFWHEKDWKVDQEKSIPHIEQAAVEIPDFSLLGTHTFLPAPQPRRVKIDHRYGDQQFFPNESGIDWLEDGGLVLYDGSGCEIRMTAGSITFSAPGDVWFRAGRNAMLWGGRDVVLRAKNSVDITCTEKDIRFSANKNLHMLGGNSGTGGVLIESRASSPMYDFENKVGEDVVSGGIMLRAAKSEIVTWGQNVYLRTGGGDIRPGVIMLDADKGNQDIVINSRYMMQYIDQSAFWFFGKEGQIRKTNEFSEYWATIATGVCVNAQLLVDGDILNKGWIMTADGHIATQYAPSFDLRVAPLTGKALEAVRDAVADCHQRAENDLPKVGSNYYAASLIPTFYAEKRPGNDSVIQYAQVSLRNVEQYRTQDFAIFEDRWQQLSRLSGRTSQTWTERPVACPADPETYPYPGKENFRGNTLYQQDLTLFEINGGRGSSKDRGEAGQLADPYKNPTYGNPTAVTLNGNYPTIT